MSNEIKVETKKWNRILTPEELDLFRKERDEELKRADEELKKEEEEAAKKSVS